MSVMKRFKLVLATAAVLVGGTVGFAAANGQTGGHRGDPAARAAWKQKHQERKAEMLQKFDANKNGVLDPAEKQVMHDERVTKIFTKLDTNKDGSVSLAEMKAGKLGRMGRHGHGKHRGMGKPGAMAPDTE